PVIFVPGNAGSYRQVRSLATESASEAWNWTRSQEGCRVLKDRNPELALDCSTYRPRKLTFFALDFREELSAFRGTTLLDQAEYLNDALRFVQGLYLAVGARVPPTVAIVAHSMGGIVARAAFTLPNHSAGSVDLLVTLATPHARAPLALDRATVQLYGRLASAWEASSPSVALVSIAGGNRDHMFGSELCTTSGFASAGSSFTAFTTGIADVWLTTDHLSILWCNQLVRALSR
ncbi:GPI inositol-deacylase PGAP1-like protein, partial [Hyaloraphidium curvatum]